MERGVASLGEGRDSVMARRRILGGWGRQNIKTKHSKCLNIYPLIEKILLERVIPLDGCGTTQMAWLRQKELMPLQKPQHLSSPDLEGAPE